MSSISDLSKVLSDIREKTGIDVRLAPHGGIESKFQLDYCGERIAAYINGTGDAAEKTAKLICYLVGSVDLKQLVPKKEDYLKNILLGEGGGWYVYRFMTKYNLPSTPCCALELTLERMLPEAISHIESCLSSACDMVIGMDDRRLAVVKFSEELSIVEFGQFLCQSLYEELGVKSSVGIGCEVKTFADIAHSYNQAATAMRMSELLKSKGEVHTYREYLLVKMLEDVPEGRLKEYMEQFQVSGTAEIFADEEMIGTAEEFLENSLNISETSRNLFMHRNTLMYRLDKIERITGLNIRNFADAVTFRIITILYKLLQ